MIKKIFSRKMLMGFSALAMSFMLMGTYNITAFASEGLVAECKEDNGITPHSDIIEYRYKVEGTKMYRRLYNYSKECWVGEWEFIGEGFIEPGM